MSINRRTMTKLPLFAALVGVSSLTTAKSPELTSTFDDSVPSPVSRIDRAKAHLDFIKQLPRTAVDRSTGATVLSHEDMIEMAEEYLCFLTAGGAL